MSTRSVDWQDADQVVVFGQPNCVQCKATERELQKLGVEYISVDMTEDTEALEHWKAQGFRNAPVVLTPGGAVWGGYNREKIRAHAVGGTQSAPRAASGHDVSDPDMEPSPHSPEYAYRHPVGIGR